MSAGDEPYRISLLGNVPAEIRRLAGVAASLGKKQAYLDAWLDIEKRISSAPSGFGELRFNLLKGELHFHVGAVRPVVVNFAFHEKERVVFVLEIFLLES